MSLDPCYSSVGCIGLVWRREGGLSITTISGSNIRKLWFTRGISLPVRSDVTATPCYWRIARLRMLLRGGLLMPRCLYLVKWLDPPPLRPRSVMLQTVPQLMFPLLSKTQETLCSSLEDEAVAAAVMTTVILSMWMIFNRQAGGGTLSACAIQSG